MSALYLEAKRSVSELLNVSCSAQKTILKVRPGVNAGGQRDVVVKSCFYVRKTQQVEMLYSMEGCEKSVLLQNSLTDLLPPACNCK